MSVASKLQIKDGQRVLVANQPADVDLGLPAEAATNDPTAADAVVAFVTRRSELHDVAAAAIEAGHRDQLAWVAYPKAGKLGTDLNRDSLNAAMNENGLQAVRQVAIDDVWSALRFRPATTT
jgi:hypothetical protein